MTVPFEEADALTGELFVTLIVVYRNDVKRNNRNNFFEQRVLNIFIKLFLSFACVTLRFN